MKAKSVRELESPRNGLRPFTWAEYKSDVLAFAFCHALSLFLCSVSLAEEPPAPVQGPPSSLEPLPSNRPSSSTDESSTMFKPIHHWWNDKLSWETGAGRSYVLPAGEILLYEFLLNLF